MDKILELITYFEKLATKSNENFNLIEYEISKIKKQLLLDFDFWNKFSKKNDNQRFIIVINFLNIDTEEEFSLKIDEKLELFLPTDSVFTEKISNFVSIIEENIDFSDKKDYTLLQKAIESEIINIEDYKITNLEFTIRKNEISDYILLKYKIPKIYRFNFWSSLKKFNKHMKNESLKSLSMNLLEKDKIIAIVVPDNEIFFTNFFEIYSLNKINNIKKENEIIKSKADFLKKTISKYREETVFVEKTPIFPIDFDSFNRDKLNKDFWLSYSRILIYTIYSLISNKVIIKQHQKKEFFDFHYGRYQIQTLNFEYDENDNLILNTTDNNKNQFIYSEEEIIEMVTTLTMTDYFSGIGDEKNIRVICIERVLSSQINNLYDLVENYENLITAQKILKKDLIRDRIAQINESYKHIDSILSKSASEISIATTKITQEIIKTFLTLIGSTIVTLFGWYLKFLNADFPIPEWFYQILSPIIGIVFISFFLMQIISTRMGVVSQIRIYNQSKLDLIEKIGVKVNEEIEQNLWKNRNAFNIYFSIFLVISLFFISSIIFIIIRLNS